MSQKYSQIYTTNPTGFFQTDDILILARAPYAPGSNFGFIYSSLIPLENKGDLFTYNGSLNSALSVGSDGTLLVADSGSATGLNWTTAAFPTDPGAAGTLLTSDGTDFVNTQSTYPSAAGTGISTAGQILISNGANFVNSSAQYPATAGTNNTILQSNGSSWVNSAIRWPASTTVNQILWSSGANIVTGLATANNATLITSSGGVPSLSTTLPVAVQTNITELGTVTVGTWNATAVGPTFGGTGQTTYTLGDTLYASASNVLSKLSGNTTATQLFLSQTGTGSASAAPVWSAISTGALTVSTITTSQTAAVNNVYITNGGSLVVLNLPATFAVGDIVGVVNRSGAGFKITHTTTGQSIKWESTSTTVTTGSIANNFGSRDTIYLMGTVANTTWTVLQCPSAALLTFDGTTNYNILQNSLSGVNGSGAFAGDTGASVSGYTLTSSNIVGDISGTDAPSGDVGAITSSIVALGSAISLTTGTALNVTSLSLTAGDYDIYGTVGFVVGGATTMTSMGAALNTNSATLPTPDSINTSVSVIKAPLTTGASQSLTAGSCRISTNAPITVYLVAIMDFAIGTAAAYGSIWARIRR